MFARAPHPLIASLALLAGCASGPVEPPGQARILPDLVEVTSPRDGAITVRGSAGAVVGPAGTITLTAFHEERGVLHAGHEGLPVASTYAAISPDGGFGPVTLGEPDRPVRSGDMLALTPQLGTAQAGAAVSISVP